MKALAVCWQVACPRAPGPQRSRVCRLARVFVVAVHTQQQLNGTRTTLVRGLLVRKRSETKRQKRTPSKSRQGHAGHRRVERAPRGVAPPRLRPAFRRVRLRQRRRPRAALRLPDAARAACTCSAAYQRTHEHSCSPAPPNKKRLRPALHLHGMCARRAKRRRARLRARRSSSWRAPTQARSHARGTPRRRTRDTAARGRQPGFAAGASAARRNAAGRAQRRSRAIEADPTFEQ
jgi:hypothetical protein